MQPIDNKASFEQALYSSEQVRELDRRIIAAGTPGFVLMRRAAAAVFEAITNRYPDARSLCVFCGKGNNGGDGFLVARIAADKGWAVQVVEVGFGGSVQEPDPSPTTDAGRARQALFAAAVRPLCFSSLDETVTEHADVVVDALLGTGLSGELRDEFAQAIATINRAAKPVVAVDIPSGICSDSGLKLGEQAVQADCTVSFIGLKKGLFTADATEHVGELVFDDLQADENIVNQHPCDTRLCDIDKLLGLVPQKSANSFKNKAGHLLVVGGDHGMGGAPLLTAAAALRCGAGLVSVATRPENTSAVIARQPEIMAKGLVKPVQVVPMLERATALAVGPGLGNDVWSEQLLCHVLLYLTKMRAMPLLLDADALNLIAARPDLATLYDNYVQDLERQLVLTPHPGEAARLLKRKETNRYAQAEQLVCRYRATIVLKGAGTLIADAGQIAVCRYGNPALASAGSGDVLSGIVGAYLAQGLAVSDAARLGVCLHAVAADRYREEFGPAGLLADDIADWVVEVLNQHARELDE